MVRSIFDLTGTPTKHHSQPLPFFLSSMTLLKNVISHRNKIHGDQYMTESNPHVATYFIGDISCSQNPRSPCSEHPVIRLSGFGYPTV